MRVSRTVATAALVVTCFVGVATPASARDHVTACGRSGRATSALEARDQKLGNRISRLQTAISTTPDSTVAAKLQRRLDRLKSEQQKIADAIAKIQSTCGSH
jgi:hypothetical protein